MPDSRDRKYSPTFSNIWVADSICGCKIFETVLSRAKQPVDRRPTDSERADVIKSGNVFVYRGMDNGIKRWTDGRTWSASRVAGNFFLYCELAKPMTQDESKAYRRRPQHDEDEEGSHSPPDDESSASQSQSVPQQSQAQAQHPNRPSRASERPQSDRRLTERTILGTLETSFNYKPGGLIKKTMSVTVEGQKYQLISYYNPEDVRSGLLKDSNHCEELVNVQPRLELLTGQSWRAPLDYLTPVGPGLVQVGPPGSMSLPMQGAAVATMNMRSLPAYQLQAQYGYQPTGTLIPGYGYQAQGAPTFQGLDYQQTALSPPNLYYQTSYPPYPSTSAHPRPTSATGFTSGQVPGGSYPGPAYAGQYNPLTSPNLSHTTVSPSYPTHQQQILPSQRPNQTSPSQQYASEADGPGIIYNRGGASSPMGERGRDTTVQYSLDGGTQYLQYQQPMAGTVSFASQPQAPHPYPQQQQQILQEPQQQPQQQQQQRQPQQPHAQEQQDEDPRLQQWRRSPRYPRS